MLCLKQRLKVINQYRNKMCDYGISETERKIICAQAERRAKYRQEFLRLRTDPCKHAQEAGHVVDPAHLRFQAMKACQFDYFQANPRTITAGLMIILPMLGYGYLVWNQRTKFLEDCRCGRIAYRDRLHKLQ